MTNSFSHFNPTRERLKAELHLLPASFIHHLTSTHSFIHSETVCLYDPHHFLKVVLQLVMRFYPSMSFLNSN